MVKPYFEDGAVTIYHGDCRDILPTLGPVDLVLTDPPYGVGLAEWDEFLAPELWLPLAQAVAALVMVTPGNANQYSYPPPTWTAAWFRPGSVQRAYGGGFSHWEPILIYGKNPLPYDARQIANLQQGVDGHPCAKPLYLFQWLIENATQPTQSVCDPFMGSGTTLRAAKDLGRRAIGIEIEERYCEIAAKRMAQGVLL